MSANFYLRPKCEGIIKCTWDLNPNASNRPLRDGAWIEKQWEVIKTLLTKVHVDFRRSGNQEAENIFSEWFKFSSKYPDHVTYAVTVMPTGALDQLGKALPELLQKDSGDLDSDIASPNFYLQNLSLLVIQILLGH